MEASCRLQVYPRSFKDANGDGLSDIAGVTEKIPYLKTLGVDAIWLSPFYPSDLADGGYDVIDYRNVDPRLGTMDDFDAMVAAAHEAGIKVIVDIVPNYTADKHVFFQEALAAGPGSPERDRYIFRDGRGEHGELPPNDWISLFGGPAWEQVPDGQRYLHIFAKQPPDVNWNNPDIHEEFKKTLRFWSDHGTDGFRIDVAHGLAKDLESTPLDQMDRWPCSMASATTSRARSGTAAKCTTSTVNGARCSTSTTRLDSPSARHGSCRSASICMRAPTSSVRCSTSSSPKRTGMWTRCVRQSSSVCAPPRRRTIRRRRG